LSASESESPGKKKKKKKAYPAQTVEDSDSGKLYYFNFPKLLNYA